MTGIAEPDRSARRSVSIAVVAALLITGVLLGAAVVTVSAAPSRPTRDDAALAYLRLAGPANARIAELGRRVGSAVTLEEMQAISLAYAEVEASFAADLRTLAVPSEVDDEVAVALEAIEHVAALDRRAAETSDGAAALGQELGVALDTQRDRLGRLRAALGLGPVPGG